MEVDHPLDYEEYLRILGGYHCDTKRNWADQLPEKYRDYLWLLMERDRYWGNGYFAFNDDAVEIAGICGCQLRQYHPPMGKDVPYVFLKCGEELERLLDLLDDHPKGFLLCQYEGQGIVGQDPFTYVAVNPIVAQTSLFT